MSNRARPIPEVLGDERTEPRIRKLLAEIPRVKEYGERAGLKPTSNYMEYVKLDRPAAVWVVSACAPLKFEPRKWRFPVVGSFTYLGWFDLESAKRHAEELRAEGWDADVRGAGAYSTLGWFRDSVLSSMIPPGDEALGSLVNVVLHESVHATLYVDHQSAFSESVASFVADRLTPEYLSATLGEGAPEFRAYLEAEKRSERRSEFLYETYGKLDALYGSGRPEAELLAEKSRILADAKAKTGFPREINNATLIQFKTYHSDLSSFERLLKRCDSKWDCFWKRLETLKKEPARFGAEQVEGFTAVVDAL